MKYERGSFITVGSRDTLRGLHPTAQALYMWLSSYANETGNCFPSRKTLADDCGCSEDTVDKMLVVLIEKDLVIKQGRVQDGEKLSNLYTVLIQGGSRQKRLPQPLTAGTVAARNGINSIQLTQPIEQGASDYERLEVSDPFSDSEEKTPRVILLPYSPEGTCEYWMNSGDRRLQILGWYLTEAGLWSKATTVAKLKAIMARHNNAAKRIARADWSLKEVREARQKILSNENLHGEWTLETVEKYLTK